MTDTTIKALEAQSGGTELGAINVMQGSTPVKISKTTVVDQAGAEVDFATGAEVTAITTSLGTDGGTGPANGTGVRGWLRSIYDRLTAGIGRTWTLASGTDSVTVTGNIGGTVTANQGTAGAQAWPVSGPLTDTQLRAQAVPVSGPLTDTQLRAQAVNVALTGVGTDVATPAIMRRVPNSLCVNQTGAAAAAVTLTLPAVAGQFHYIDVIEITLYSTAARTGAATPITVTSTNLPGAPTWLFATAGAIGTTLPYAISASCAIKSSAANTATTIVCPAVTGGIWNVKAIYSTAP